MNIFDEGENKSLSLQAWEGLITDVMGRLMPGVIAKMEGHDTAEIVDLTVEITDGLHNAWLERKAKFEAGNSEAGNSVTDTSRLAWLFANAKIDVRQPHDPPKINASLDEMREAIDVRMLDPKFEAGK